MTITSDTRAPIKEIENFIGGQSYDAGGYRYEHLLHVLRFRFHCSTWEIDRYPFVAFGHLKL